MSDVNGFSRFEEDWFTEGENLAAEVACFAEGDRIDAEAQEAWEKLLSGNVVVLPQVVPEIGEAPVRKRLRRVRLAVAALMGH